MTHQMCARCMASAIALHQQSITIALLPFFLRFPTFFAPLLSFSCPPPPPVAFCGAFWSLSPCSLPSLLFPILFVPNHVLICTYPMQLSIFGIRSLPSLAENVRASFVILSHSFDLLPTCCSASRAHISLTLAEWASLANASMSSRTAKSCRACQPFCAGGRSGAGRLARYAGSKHVIVMRLSKCNLSYTVLSS